MSRKDTGIWKMVNNSIRKNDKLTLELKPGLVNTSYFAKKKLLHLAVELFTSDSQVQYLDIKLPFVETDLKNGREATRHKIARLKVSRTRLEFRLQLASASGFSINMGQQDCFSGKLSDYSSRRKTNKFLRSFIMSHKKMVLNIVNGMRWWALSSPIVKIKAL